jgi:hypothetical protein
MSQQVLLCLTEALRVSREDDRRRRMDVNLRLRCPEAWYHLLHYLHEIHEL